MGWTQASQSYEHRRSLDPQLQPSGGFGFTGGVSPVPGSYPPGGSVDPLLIQQTKNEIRALVQEITQLSRAAIPAEQFYDEFLRRVVSARQPKEERSGSLVTKANCSSTTR